jgi:hypothetical protein
MVEYVELVRTVEARMRHVELPETSFQSEALHWLLLHDFAQSRVSELRGKGH